MTNLLKADFKRVFKDKMLLVVCILAVVFSVITPVLYALLFSGMDDSLVELGLLVNAKGMFFDSFVPGNNLGLIAPVLLAIVLWKDFGQGTVRNKLISGYSRTSIVLSMYTVCLTVLFVVMLLHALLSLGIGRLFFPYQGYPFTWADFGYFMASLGLELLVYLFMAALVCWLCAVSKNVGLVIVGYVAILMGLTMVASSLQICELALSVDEGHKTALKIIEFLNGINVFNSSMMIGKGTTYETKDLLYHIIPPAVGTAALLGHGLLKFNRKDLK